MVRSQYAEDLIPGDGSVGALPELTDLAIKLFKLYPSLVLVDLDGLFTGNMADKVETVTPWLVDGVLKANKDGAKVMWLTNGKVMGRFLTSRFKKRDLFAEEN